MQEKIVKEIAEFLTIQPQDIELTADLNDRLSIGPIELANLLSHLSEVFAVTITPDERDEIQTTEDIVVLIEDKKLEE